MLTREQDLDCMSHLCQFAVTKTGVRTNGRCTCVDKLLSQIFEQRQTIEAQAAELGHWRETAKELGMSDGHCLALEWQQQEARIKQLEAELVRVKGTIEVGEDEHY